MFDQVYANRTYRLSDGRVVKPGQLHRRRDGLWEEPSPIACPNGYPLG